MAGLKSTAGDLWRGFWLPVAGARLIAKDARLLLFAALPTALTAVATLVAGGAAFWRGKALLARVWSIDGPCTGCGLWRWSWTRLEAAAFEAAFIVLVLLAAAVAGLVASRVLAAPAMDALSRRAMRGDGAEAGALGDRPLAIQLGRSLLRGLGHAALYLVGAGLIACLALVPGGAAAATPLQVVWAATWLFVDTMLYPLQWTGEAGLGETLGLVRRRPALSLGFATGQAVLLFVPFAALVVTPATIAGACLFVGEVERA